MILALVLVFQSSVGLAQMDPSSAMLLKGSRAPSAAETAVQNGRYQMKTAVEESVPPTQIGGQEVAVKLKKSKKGKALPAKEVSSAQLEAVYYPPENEVVTQSLPIVPKSNTVEKLAFKPVEKPVEKPPEKPAEKETTDLQPPPVANQLIDLVSGQSQPFIEAYKEQVHPDDIRLNRMELQFLPGLMYNDSKANYSYRTYQTFSPKYTLGARFWLTPFIGFHGEVMNSLAADVAGADRSRVAAKHENTEIGIDFRRYFGLSRKSNSVEFGIHYFEYKFSVPGDDVTRTKIKSSGAGFHVMARLPTAPSFAWTLGSKVVPKMSQSELSTGVNVISGGTPDASRFAFSIGGEIKLSRQHQLIVELGYSVEKSQYSGTASPVDPETGLAPAGVSVTNGVSTLSFGYRWGQ